MNLNQVVDIEAVISQLNPPMPYVPEWFTKELTKLGGYADNGKDPQLRLVWGGSATQFFEGRMRIKYPKYSKKMQIGVEYPLPNGQVEFLPMSSLKDPNEKRVGRIVEDWVDVGMPFFFVEEWLAPEIACEGWDHARYKWEGLKCIDKLGPPPTEGFYRELFRLRTDDGQYMPPNEETLVYIKKLLWVQRQDPALYSKRERPPAFLLQKLLRERLKQIELNERQWEDNIVEQMWDRIRMSLLNPTSLPSVDGQRAIITSHKY